MVSMLRFRCEVCTRLLSRWLTDAMVEFLRNDPNLDGIRVDRLRAFDGIEDRGAGTGHLLCRPFLS